MIYYFLLLNLRKIQQADYFIEDAVQLCKQGKHPGDYFICQANTTIAACNYNIPSMVQILSKGWSAKQTEWPPQQ